MSPPHRRCSCGVPMYAVTYMAYVYYACPACDLADSWPIVQLAREE
jgi:hypothetical protein